MGFPLFPLHFTIKQLFLIFNLCSSLTSLQFVNIFLVLRWHFPKSLWSGTVSPQSRHVNPLGLRVRKGECRILGVVSSLPQDVVCLHHFTMDEESSLNLALLCKPHVEISFWSLANNSQYSLFTCPIAPFWNMGIFPSLSYHSPLK